MEQQVINDEYSLQATRLKDAIQRTLLESKATDKQSEQSVAFRALQAFAEVNPSLVAKTEEGFLRPTPFPLDVREQANIALRSLLTQLVAEACASEQHVMQYRKESAALPSVPCLLDLAFWMGEVKLVEPSMMLGLLEDLAEISTIDESAEVFEYLERATPAMRSHFDFVKPSGAAKLSVLRICNQLLRRLSRAHHVVLGGRIHLFLAQLMPLSDRSAVNAASHVNTSHATEVEEFSEGALDTNGKPVDANFYTTFWGLQHAFQHPLEAINPNVWTKVYSAIKVVLAEFARTPMTVAAGSLGGGAGAAADSDGLTVKYLSSSKLMHLQLRDAGLRRHFLVQALTLLQACSRKATAKQDTLKIKQQGEADELQELLFKELARTPEHGSQFAKAIRALLRHEDEWADWKAAGCPAHEKSPVTVPPVPRYAKRKPVDPTVVNLGTSELNRLWNLTSDNLSAIRRDNPKRQKVETLREFLDPVLEDMDPENDIEDQYRRKHEAVYQWKAMRYVATCSIHALTAALNKKRDLEEAVRVLYPQEAPVRKEEASAADASQAAAGDADASSIQPNTQDEADEAVASPAPEETTAKQPAAVAVQEPSNPQAQEGVKGENLSQPDSALNGELGGTEAAELAHPVSATEVADADVTMGEAALQERDDAKQT